MKKLSFAKGAFLLAMATGLGKVFSAIFKIPLDRFFLHDEGMAVFNSVYNTYMFFFAAATAGFPLAISRLVASAKDEEEENSILSTALVFMFVILGIFSMALMVFSEHIAAITGIPDAAFGFRIMSPALLFCAITAAFKGFFQGKMYMFPSALSQATDSLGRLIAGFGIAFILLGKSVSTVSAGALAGVPFGAFLSALILGISYIKLRRPFKLTFSGKILKSLLFLAIPITITTSLHAIFNMVDTLTVVPTLNSFGYSAAQNAFGHLGRAAMLYALPVSIATAVAASALPAVTENFKNNDNKSLLSNSSLAIRLTLLISLPCTAGFIALPREIFNFLFDNSSNSQLLAIIAPSAVFLSLGCTLSGILQGLGKTRLTLISAICAIVAKIILTPLLIQFFGINGAAGATSISYMLFTLLLIFFTAKHTSLRYPLLPFTLKPAVCALTCYIASELFSKFLQTLFVIPISAFLYMATIIISHFVTLDEFKQFTSSR